MKTAKNNPEGFGPNPFDLLNPSDEDGIRNEPRASGRMTPRAKKQKDEVLKRFGKRNAKRAALTKILNRDLKLIPASPTK